MPFTALKIFKEKIVHVISADAHNKCGCTDKNKCGNFKAIQAGTSWL